MNPVAYPREMRARWYLQVDQSGKSVKEVCAVFGIARKTYYKWYAQDHSKKRSVYQPCKVQPNLKLTPEVCAVIEREKKYTYYGPLKMKMAVKRKLDLDVSTTIIYHYYKRRMLIRRPQRPLPWYRPMKKKLCVKAPGQGVQLDVKYVYEGSLRRYQFTVLDPSTQLLHFTISDTRESKNAIIALQAARKFFGFNITSVQTDNGSEFRGVFHRWLDAKNIRHYFIPKHSPWWNAYVERVHKTIDDEFYHNELRPRKTRHEWLHFYNTERIHLTLNGLTPREKAKQSVRF